MKKYLLLVLGIALFACQKNSEHKNLPPVKKALTTSSVKPVTEAYSTPPPDLTSFIPKGFSGLDTAKGDLNLDSIDDLILILKDNRDDTTTDVTQTPEQRPLLLLIGKADQTYQLAGRNDNVVLCKSCGGTLGDPYQGITIKNGYFSVEHYGGSSWRWTRIITFKYSPTDTNWFLHKDGEETYHSSNPNKSESHIKTVKDFGKVPFESFDVNQE